MGEENSVEQEQEIVVVFDDIEYNYEEMLSSIEAELQDVSSELGSVVSYMETMQQNVSYLAGFGLFGIVVLLCIFIYKFFRMFI